MTKMSASAVVAHDPPSSVELRMVRRVDSRESLLSLARVVNRPEARATATEIASRAGAHDGEFHREIAAVRRLRRCECHGGARGRVAIVVPSAPQADAHMPAMHVTHVTRGRSEHAWGDPPPPYAPPGDTPATLPACAPPPYTSSDAMHAGDPILRDLPPPYERPSIDWYLRQGYPRADV